MNRSSLTRFAWISIAAAIITIILAVVHAGDEVIVLEPCYDSYVPNIELAGGVPVRVPLTPGTFRPDFDKIAGAITSKTRAIIVNSPHNPSATVWTEAEMLKTPNFGRKSLNEIKHILLSMGLHFGMDVPGWPPVDIENLAKKLDENL